MLTKEEMKMFEQELLARKEQILNNLMIHLKSLK